MDTIRMGIIGLGNMGGAHLQAIAAGDIKGMRLAAVADTDPARLAWAAAAAPGVPGFDSAAGLLASGLVDAVLIATPHWAHPDIALQAMARGLHVLTEKPAGVSLSQVRQVNAAHAASGVVYGIMFNQRTNPLYARARQLVQSGALGQPKRLVWIITNWYRTQGYYNSGAWRASWRGEGGGVLLNQAPHNLDLWQWIFGMPQRLFAVCNVGKYHDIEVEDEAALYAEYANGASATFLTSTGEYPGTNRLEIDGDAGKLVLEDGLLKWWRLEAPETPCRLQATAGQPPAVHYSEIAPSEPETAHRGILQNFADAVLHGAPLLAPGEEGIHELTLSNAAYLSAWQGGWVTLPPDAAAFDAALAERVAASRYTGTAVQAAPKDADNGYKARWSVRW